VYYKNIFHKIIKSVIFSILLIFFLIPVSFLIIRYLSTNFSIEIFAKTIFSQRLLISTANSIILAISVSITSAIAGTLLAIIFSRIQIKYYNFFLLINILVYALPSFVVALGYTYLFGNILNGFWGSYIILSIVSTPIILLSVLYKLNKISNSLELAAKNLGSSNIAIVFQILIPQILPNIISGMSLVMVYVLGEFGVVTFLQFNTLTRIIYIEYLTGFKSPVIIIYSITLIFITTITITILWLISKKFRNNNTYNVFVESKSSVFDTSILAKLKYLLLMLLPVLGIVLPFSSFFKIILSTTQNELIILNYIQSSIYVSSISVLISIVLAIGFVFIFYFDNYIKLIFVKILKINNVLPGLIVGISLLIFSLMVYLPIYQTFTLLYMAYIIKFFVQLYLPINDQLQSITKYYNTAKQFKVSNIKYFTHIIFPLIVPSIVAGGIILFMSVFKELPITLILSPYNFGTLATQIWFAYQEGFVIKTAYFSLMMISIVIGLFVLSRLIIKNVKYDIRM
jgi:iron(III) transport system permease protein